MIIPEDWKRADELHLLLSWMSVMKWATGTGGGLCVRIDGRTYYSPTGCHKDLLAFNEFFVEHGQVMEAAPGSPPGMQPTACLPIFRAILGERRNGAVIHTHSQWAVLATESTPHGCSDEWAAPQTEMVKGLAGYSYLGTYRCPVIANTPTEPELVESFCHAYKWPEWCVMIADHGAYIWGSDLLECKRHAEVLHWLWEYSCRRRHMLLGQ